MIQVLLMTQTKSIFLVNIFDDSGYLITKQQKLVKEQAITWFKNQEEYFFIKVGNIIENYDILTGEEKRIAFIGNKMKRTPEMNPEEIELEARRTKASNMQIKELIKKEKKHCQILVKKIC